jgi:general stress protein YciG
MVAKEDRGFASMDRSKQKEIASKGGKAAHQKGTAHEWTSEEAREAGRKGGMASHRRKMEGGNDSGEAMVSGSSQESPSHYSSEESQPEAMGSERMSDSDNGDGMR